MGLPVGGRLRHFVSAWQQLGDEVVIDIITNGLRLELQSLPEQDQLPFRLLLPEQEDILAQEVDALLVKNGVKALDYLQEFPAPRTHVAAGFCVPKPTGWGAAVGWGGVNWEIIKRGF